MAYIFDEAYYLAVKTAQQNAIKHEGRTDWTVPEVAAAIASIGMTPMQHYEAFGRSEGLNPNGSFDEAYYLEAKTAQQNSIRHEGRTDWTVAEVAAAISSIGMIPAQHYETFGCFETFADGSFINPSAADPTATFWQAAVDRLRGATSGVEWTLDYVMASYQSSGISIFDTTFVPPYPEPGPNGKTITINDNAIRAVTGTTYRDVITVAQKGRVTGKIDGETALDAGNGDDDIIVAGSVIGAITGGEGKDTITVAQSGMVGTLHGSDGIIYGGGGDDVITVHGVAASIDGGAGNDTIVLDSETALIHGIKGGDGDDHITVLNWWTRTVDGGNGNDTIVVSKVVNDFIEGGNGDDHITVTNGAWTNAVRGGNGNDTIIIEAGATVYNVLGGAGADTVILRQDHIKVEQYTGHSGKFSTALINPGGEVAAKTFDLVDCGGLSARLFVPASYNPGYFDNSYATWAGGLHKVAAPAGIGVADNTAYWLQGTYSDGTFTANGAGGDALLVYDAGAGTAIAMEAMVLLGVSDLAIDGHSIMFNPA